MSVVIGAACFAIVMLIIVSRPLQDGVIHLKNASSKATLLTEGDTGFQHIEADNLEMAMYTQGYAHAQMRLWQMHKQRMLAKGRLSEMFGEKAIKMD